MCNIPFTVQPGIAFIDGKKHRIKLDQIKMPKFATGTMATLKTYSMDLKAVFSDLMMKVVAGILVPKGIRSTHRMKMDSITRDGFTLEVRWSKALHEVVIFEPILMVEWCRRGGFGSRSKMLKEYIAHDKAKPEFIKYCQEALLITKMTNKQRNAYKELLAWHSI